jgi:HEAT repeat protein
MVLLCATVLPAFAGVEQTVNDLIPKLAAQQVEDRYGPQMELQALALNAARPGAEAERAEMAGILAAKATDTAVPQPARVWLVRQLEYIGAGESVAALTTLLNGPDGELKECARRALEKNPAPSAGAPLRAALQQGGDIGWRKGLIQSLGERRDTAAVQLLSRELSTETTAPAAISALGKIADPKAMLTLWEAYDAHTAGAADGLIVAGNRLLAAGDKTAAKNLFQRLYVAGAASQSAPDPLAAVQVRSAALLGWATADPATAGIPIAEALQQQQPELQFAAVTAATAVFQKIGVSKWLAPVLGTLSPTAKVYALRVLDASAEQAVIVAARDQDEAVQLAALERLGQIGGAASVPVLCQAAVSGAGGVKKAAAAALARISGPGADAAIAKLAGEGEAKTRVVAIYALAQRADQSASPALLTYAGEADPEVSAAACAALAKLGTDRELDGLIRLVRDGKTPGAAAALQGVAARTTDKSAAAQKLIAQTQAAEPQQLATLLDILALLGGQDGLAAVSSFAGSGSAEVKDTAIRALANWPDFPATKTLLVVAFDPNTKRVHNVLAIQAVARLVKSADKEPADARLKAVLAALTAAKREEEKKLLLSALASVPDRKAADAMKPFLSDPQLRNDAGPAAMTLAEALRKTDKPAARDLAQAIRDANLSPALNRKTDVILGRKQ